MIGNRGALVGVSLGALIFIAGGQPTSSSAQTAPTVVIGKITKITSTELSVKTSTRVVTGKMSTITLISKSVRTSVSAVAKGAFVTLTLAANSKTVIEMNVGNRGLGAFPRGGFPRSGRPPQAPRSGSRPPGSFGRRPFQGGQVVSISRNQLRLKSFRGATTTYTLSKSVTVTKTVRGSRSDLHVGETVRIIPIRADNSAFSLTIVSG